MMRALAWLPLLATLVLPAVAAAQPRDSASVASDSVATRRPSRWYFGGSMGISFTDRRTLVIVQPLVGYKLTPKASLGLRGGYEYWRDGRFDPANTSTSYGGGLFARYRVHPRGYLHTEFELVHLEVEDERDWVPFLWLGGGYTRPLAPRTALVIEVLVDVLRDDRAPSYRSREPRVNVGVVVGF